MFGKDKSHLLSLEYQSSKQVNERIFTILKKTKLKNESIRFRIKKRKEETIEKEMGKALF